MSRLRAFIAGCFVLSLCSTLVAQPTPFWVPLNEEGHQGFGSSVRINPYDPHTIITGGDIFGAAISNDDGATWQTCAGMATTNGNNPCVNEFTWVSPTTVWCGTLAGPYLSTDGGHTFTIQRSGMPTPLSQSTLTAPIQKVIVDPNTPSTLLAFGGNHRHMGYNSSNWGTVWKSTNSGSSWTSLVTLPSSTMVNDAGFANGSSTVVYAATDSGMYISTNSGTSWTAINSGLPSSPKCYSIAFSPNDPATIWIGLNNGQGIYKTSNGGTTSTTWSACNGSITMSDLGTAPCYTVLCAPTNTSVSTSILYAGFWQNGTYYSSNGGSSWSKIVWAGTNSNVSPPSGVPGNLGFQDMDIDPKVASTVVGTGASNVWKSTNSGIAWTTLTNFPSGSTYRGNGYSGVSGTYCAWVPGTPNQTWCVGGDCAKMLRTNDYFWTWATSDTFTGIQSYYNGSYSVSFATDGTIYIGAGQADSNTEPIIKGSTSSGGSGWGYITYPSGATGYCEGVYTLPSNSAYVWAMYGAPGYAGTIWYSTDHGSTWTNITPSPNLSSYGVTSGIFSMYNMTVNPSAPETIYIGTNCGVFQSNSTGTSFPNTTLTGSPHDTSYCLVYPDTASNSIYALTYHSSTGGLYHWNGSAWSSQLYLSPWAYAVAVDPHNASRIALVTKTPGPTYDLDYSTGIYISTNGGTTFTPISNNLKLNSGTALTFNPDQSSQVVAEMDGGLMVADLGTSTAQSGTAQNIVGTINASTYDNGGANVAYSGSTAPSPATVAGTTHQWIKYEVNVPTTGNYNITLSAKSSASGPQYHIELNGQNVTGPMPTGNTGGSWSNITATNVHLIAGTQYLKVYCETGGGFYQSITTTLNGSMSGSTTATSSSGFNLTTDTPLAGNDWAKWAYSGVYGNFDDKKTGYSQISSVTPFGTGENHGAYGNSIFNVTWSDGTPVASASDSNTIYSNASYNSANGPTGFTFTVPASTASHTVTIFWGVSQGTFGLIGHLSDSSASDYSISETGPVGTGTQMYLTTLTFKASSISQHVTITLEKTANEPAESGYGVITNGSVDLVAAWLQ